MAAFQVSLTDRAFTSAVLGQTLLPVCQRNHQYTMSTLQLQLRDSGITQYVCLSELPEMQ